MAGEVEILARGWTFTCEGSPIGGINKFSWDPGEAKEADTTDFDSLGNQEHFIASRGSTLKLDGGYLENESGGRDTGQAAVETLAAAIGADSLGTIVVTSPGGKTKTFEATAKLTAVGGGNDDVTTWGAELHVSGVVTEA
jgi:hypothetical protein